jgi:Uma2 family endonuclease
MRGTLIETRPFEPGTTGWTADDLDDPEIEREWSAGRYEIVEGVLTKMPPAYFIGGKVLFRLMNRVAAHIGEEAGSFASEVEIVVDEHRVVRADAAFLTPAEEKRQRIAAVAAGRKDPDRTRILIPPTLIIECVSPGHEQHDHRTKRRWYAEFGVPNYWLLNPFKRTLECLVLRDGTYEDDAEGQGSEKVRPCLFPGLILRLGQIWKA